MPKWCVPTPYRNALSPLTKFQKRPLASPLPAKLGEVGASVASSGRGCDLGFGPRRLRLCLCPLPNVADGSIRPPPTASGEVTSIALSLRCTSVKGFYRASHLNCKVVHFGKCRSGVSPREATHGQSDWLNLLCESMRDGVGKTDLSVVLALVRYRS